MSILSSTAWLYCAGLVPYAQALDWQMQLVQQRREQPDLPDVLLLLEHPVVYTLGRGSSQAFLRFPERSLPLHRVGRGGEVTYHCPGQLVGYPIFNLQRHQPDLHWYLRQLEQVIIDVICTYHLPADRKVGLTGVWIGDVKVAAIGIQVKRWITSHGFALNISPDLTGFEAIVPCGIEEYGVGSLQQFIPDICYEEVQNRLIEQFARSFYLKFRLLT
ncbi:MAG: lipoyl(octanoyl) transferase LipB [Prochlorotrichaceae cyanobacterium]